MKQLPTIERVRDVDRRTNSQNQRRAMVDSRVGLLGVTQRSKNSFEAAINVRGKYLHIGSFPTGEAAHVAYVEAKRRLHAGCTL